MERDSLDFETLYRERRNMIFQLALRLLQDEEAAVDATQEAFAKAFKAQGKFRGESSPATWLYRIAYNVCLSKLGGARAETAPEDFESPDDARTRPEPEAERAETALLVKKALERLGEEDRRLLCLMMEKDMPYEDLAYVVDCPVEALRMRVSRARSRLREILLPILERKHG